MNVLALGALLVAIWVFLWGYLTVANVLSGIVVVTALLAVFPTGRPRRPTYVVRPIAILRLVLYFVRSLLVANVVLAREILTRRDRIRTGVVAVPAHGVSDGLLVLVANVVALTPGTLAIEVQRDPPAFYVHVLHLHDVERVRGEILRLEELIVRAFGAPDAIAALDGGS
jgi:multicomponent Na+:H+ antiporter subunit E